jgi:uncharacterized PurR-regulated membrane protein YhhQ (DUF165 family)
MSTLTKAVVCLAVLDVTTEFYGETFAGIVVTHVLMTLGIIKFLEEFRL